LWIGQKRYLLSLKKAARVGEGFISLVIFFPCLILWSCVYKDRYAFAAGYFILDRRSDYDHRNNYYSAITHGVEDFKNKGLK